MNDVEFQPNKKKCKYWTILAIFSLLKITMKKVTCVSVGRFKVAVQMSQRFNYLSLFFLFFFGYNRKTIFFPFNVFYHTPYLGFTRNNNLPPPQKKTTFEPPNKCLWIFMDTKKQEKKIILLDLGKKIIYGASFWKKKRKN